MKTKKIFYLICILSSLFLILISCIQHQIIGEVEDFYFPTIKAKYVYHNIKDNPMEAQRIIHIIKIDKKQWGWIFYEDHESILSKDTKAALKVKNKENGFHNYRKVILNIKDKYVEIVETNSEWINKSDKCKILKGPIWFKKKWTELIQMYSIGPIASETSDKNHEVLPNRTTRINAEFIIVKHNIVTFKNQVYNAIKSKMIIRSPDNKEMISTSVYLNGLGLYSFDNFVLKDVVDL